jgi:hypothetical protein
MISAIILLPIVPAFLLFKFLRSRGGVSGPLVGLKISFGGAFGGYLVVMVFIANYTTQIRPASLQIRGTVLFPDGEPPAGVICDVHPPEFHRFGTKFAIDMDAGKTPFLQCSAAGYDPQPIYLDKGLPPGGTLELPEPIVFRKTPPYQPHQGGPK